MVACGPREEGKTRARVSEHMWKGLPSRLGQSAGSADGRGEAAWPGGDGDGVRRRQAALAAKLLLLGASCKARSPDPGEEGAVHCPLGGIEALPESIRCFTQII